MYKDYRDACAEKNLCIWEQKKIVVGEEERSWNILHEESYMYYDVGIYENVCIVWKSQK